MFFFSPTLLPSFGFGRAVCHCRRCVTVKAISRQMPPSISRPDQTRPLHHLRCPPNQTPPSLNPVKARKATSRRPCSRSLHAARTLRRFPSPSPSSTDGCNRHKGGSPFAASSGWFLLPLLPPRSFVPASVGDQSFRDPCKCMVPYATPPVQGLDRLTAIFYGRPSPPPPFSFSSAVVGRVVASSSRATSCACPLQRIQHVRELLPSIGVCPIGRPPAAAVIHRSGQN